MKIEPKSMFLGALLGAISVFTILILFGDVKTEFIVKTGDQLANNDKEVNIKIHKTIEDGKEVANVYVVGSVSVTKEELDEELERLFNQHGIDKNDTTIRYNSP